MRYRSRLDGCPTTPHHTHHTTVPPPIGHPSRAMPTQCLLSGSQQVSILSSGRLGYPASINRSDKPVFIDTRGARMCMHGEKGALIRTWMAAEKDDPGFDRGSPCTCRNVDGLMSGGPTAACDPPKAYGPKSENLYDLLGVLGAPEKESGSRPQRLALETTGSELWVQPSGQVVCEHGNSRKILDKLQRQRASMADEQSPAHFRSSGMTRCGCIMKVPRRRGSVFGDASRARRVRIPAETGVSPNMSIERVAG